MNIMIIAGYYPPEQSADTRLNQDLAEGLSRIGHHVKVVVPFPNRGISESIKNQYINKKYEKVSENLEIFRIGSPSDYRQGIIKRGLSFLYKSLKIYRFAKKIECDICLVVSTPPTLGYVAALLSYRKKVIFKLQDAFPDSLVQSQTIGNHNIIFIILELLEKWVYKRVHKIITISDDLKKTLIKRGVPNKKIKVIYDWIDEEKCRDISREENTLFNRFNLDKKYFYVSYAGNIGQLQNLRTFIKASEIVAKYRPDIRFVVIGNGSWETSMKELLNKKKYHNFLTFPMQPTEEIASVYSLGDVGLVSLKPNVTKIALPSKTWDIMSVSRAVLCEIDLYSGLCKIINKYHCGYCTKPNDSLSMAKRIIQMYDNYSETKAMGMNGRKYIEGNLTLKSSIEKYNNFFERIGE